MRTGKHDSERRRIAGRSIGTTVWTRSLKGSRRHSRKLISPSHRLVLIPRQRCIHAARRRMMEAGLRLPALPKNAGISVGICFISRELNHYFSIFYAENTIPALAPFPLPERSEPRAVADRQVGLRIPPMVMAGSIPCTGEDRWRQPRAVTPHPATTSKRHSIKRRRGQ